MPLPLTLLSLFVLLLNDRVTHRLHHKLFITRKSRLVDMIVNCCCAQTLPSLLRVIFSNAISLTIKALMLDSYSKRTKQAISQLRSVILSYF